MNHIALLTAQCFFAPLYCVGRCAVIVNILLDVGMFADG